MPDEPLPPEPEYDPAEYERGRFDDWMAGAGFMPHNPEDPPDTRRADYLTRNNYRS